MKKFLLGTLLILSSSMVQASVENQNKVIVEDLINDDFNVSKCFSSRKKQSKDVLESIVGTPLHSTLGVDILPNGLSRDFNFTLTVQTADPKRGVYTVKIDTSATHVRSHSDVFVIARVGENFVGRGSLPTEGAQEILIKHINNNLVVSFSDIYDELFPTPIVAQQRAIFPLPHD